MAERIKMPDEQTLQAFVDGMHGSPKVSLNTETGQFEWLVDRPKEERHSTIIYTSNLRHKMLEEDPNLDKLNERWSKAMGCTTEATQTSSGAIIVKQRHG